MAADFAVERDERRAAVIGCGVAGLTTARQLQRRGFDVTIYAMSVPPDTTSNMSLAAWTPTSGLVDSSRRTPQWDAQLREAARIAYRQLQLLIGPEYGLSWIDSYALRETAPPGGVENARENPLLPPELRTGSTLLGPGEHPFPTRYASHGTTLRIEPSIYLDALVRDVLRFGGRIVIRKFDTARDLMTLDEPIVVNCTGLGSGKLFGDSEIRPLKGQLTVLVPQPEVDYTTFGGLPGAGGFIHMQPRADGIVLGNEDVDVLVSVQETIRIGREAGIPVQMTHHKVGGQRNYGQCEASIELMRDARAEGVDITFDQYPYTASNSCVTRAPKASTSPSTSTRIRRRLPGCRPSRDGRRRVEASRTGWWTWH